MELNRQCKEMWDAVNSISNTDKNKHTVITQAQETERKLRDEYQKQEWLFDAASDLLQVANDLAKEIPSVDDGSLWESHSELLRAICLAEIGKPTKDK